MADITNRPEQARSEPSLEVNFALVLSRMIDSVQQDPAELRGSVYELARIKLKEQSGDKDPAEVNRLIHALEAAIEGVEVFAHQQDSMVPLQRDLRRGSVSLSRPEVTEVRTALAAGRAASQPAAPSDTPSQKKNAARVGFDLAARRLRSVPFVSVGRLVVVILAVVAIGTIVAYWPRLRTSVQRANAPPAVVAVSPPIDAAPPAATAARTPERQAAEIRQYPDLPLPATFGIYAVSERRLQELRPLVGKVPDPRVAMSTAINTPTETTLSSGRARFIVFRRDSGLSAPDSADIRFIAKVRSVMAVDSSGKPNSSPVADSWVIRNLSIPYKIGPIDDHPEMYMLQPAAPDFVLPAGRYALVIKGQGFDFEVPGTITDPRQCLERVNAVNGAFYSPCPENNYAILPSGNSGAAKRK